MPAYLEKSTMTSAPRLLTKPILAVLVLVPPQSWLEAVDKGSWSGGLGAWWRHEFSLSGLADGVPVNHLWFVEYIVVYSLAAVALMTYLRSEKALAIIRSFGYEH